MFPFYFHIIKKNVAKKSYPNFIGRFDLWSLVLCSIFAHFFKCWMTNFRGFFGIIIEMLLWMECNDFQRISEFDKIWRRQNQHSQDVIVGAIIPSKFVHYLISNCKQSHYCVRGVRIFMKFPLVAQRNFIIRQRMKIEETRKTVPSNHFHVARTPTASPHRIVLRLRIGCVDGAVPHGLSLTSFCTRNETKISLRRTLDRNGVYFCARYFFSDHKDKKKNNTKIIKKKKIKLNVKLSEAKKIQSVAINQQKHLLFFQYFLFFFFWNLFFKVNSEFSCFCRWTFYFSAFYLLFVFLYFILFFSFYFLSLFGALQTSFVKNIAHGHFYIQSEVKNLKRDEKYKSEIKRIILKSKEAKHILLYMDLTENKTLRIFVE